MNLIDDIATGFFTAFWIFLALAILVKWVEQKIRKEMKQSQAEYDSLQKHLTDTGPIEPKNRTEIR